MNFNGAGKGGAGSSGRAALIPPPPPPAAGAILFLEPLPIDLHSFHSDSQGDVNVCLFTVHFTAIFILFYQFNLKA